MSENAGMDSLVTAVGSVVLIAAAILAGPVIGVWEAYWAAKAWNVLLVPRTHWRQLPAVVFYVLGLVYSIRFNRYPAIRTIPGEKINTWGWYILVAIAPPSIYWFGTLMLRWFY